MKNVEFLSAQNVHIEFDLASTGERIAAALIDVVAFLIYMTLVFMLLGFDNFFTQPGTSQFIWLLIIKLPWIFYNPVIEYLTKGQSLGKYILGIRVVNLKGEVPGFRELFTRWLFKGDFIWISANLFVLVWLGIAIFGALMVSISPMRQRFGDIMAGTLIIKNKSSLKYALNDVLAIKNSLNYEPKYLNVTQFTDEDMLLIKNTVQRVQQYPNEATKAFARAIAQKAASQLGLDEVPAKKLEFLQVLLQDYVVLTR